eukprot:evm.model.scf_966.3 EVM.evm.TU.scf_966.3   scf_966:9960-11518(+)
MKGSDSGERRAGGPGGPGRGRCATPDSATSNRCEDGRARAPCSGAQRGGSKRQRLSRCAESGSARSDASANAARREAGGGEGPSPWQELPFGALQMIMDELLRMEDGEAWVRRCGCVCRGWRGVSAELLMTDTAASRPPRRPPAPQASPREDGGATSLAVLREDDSMSKSVNGGGSEHQSPAFAGQAPWIGEQAPHPQAVRMIGISLDGHVTSLALRHRFPLQGRPQDLHGQEGWMPWMDFREQRLLSAQQVDSHPLGRNVRASHGRGSELTPPSPQRAVVEDVNLMSESDAEGGCGLSSLRTGECSEGSVRSRRVPQATC